MIQTGIPIHATDLLTGDRRFELLVQSVKDYAIYLLDPQGCIVSWNTGAERSKGYTAEDIIGQHFSVFYTREDREADMPAQALALACKEGKYETEGWRVHKDGRRFWTHVVIAPILDPNGALIGFAKVARDMTHKRAAAQALFESEQRFQLLVQGVRDYAIYMLDPNGYITNWNAGAALIKGYSADEIVGRHFSCFYTQEDRDRGEPERSLMLALQNNTFQTEAWRVRKDGSSFWANIVIDPIYNESGTLAGFAKITRDVTERKLAQDEIDRQRDALSQSQKLEAIGQLTGGVAHDFNNLLTIIQSSAELLRRTGLTAEKRAQYIEAIVETANRAAVLTRQLLAFARQQSLCPEAFSVQARIDGLRRIIETTVGDSIETIVDIPENLSDIDADASQFDTAILNMVINARDAMPRGGTLRISARNTQYLPPVRKHAGAVGDFVAISLADSGTGIDNSVVGRIFEPFFTTKALNKGTGLGLSQVYGFAKQSGGDVDVEGRPGKGTTFTLYLPRAKPDEPALPEPAEDEQPMLPSRCILLVEDNELVGQFARSMLTDLGHKVIWATSGAAALEVLEIRSNDFDLVLSDVMMPGISGIDLGKEIRRRWPDLRVVLTSGYSHVLVQESDHGFEFLQKPYSLDSLLAVIAGSERARH